jgi:succinoglycan biosynthesis protein ExoO
MAEATVMIAAWNAVGTIARSVKTAQAQADVATEVVVVDDASTDDTAQHAGAAGAVVLRMQANGGPAAARNRAVEAARGHWLAVLDADDAMEPDRLRRMIDQGKAAEADVVMGNFRTVREDGAPLDPEPFLAGPDFERSLEWSLEDFLAGNQVRPGSRPLGYLKPLFRRAFLLEHGLRYDPSLRNGEDFHLVLACLAAGAKVVFSPPPLYLYTVRRGSISHRADPAHISALIEADLTFLERRGGDLSARAAALFALRGDALRELRDSEEILQALKARRLRDAVVRVLRKPSIARRVGRQLLEALRNRARPKSL